MNRLTPLYGLCLLLLLGSCSIFESEQDFTQIEGRWEWVRASGGFAGTTISPDSAGYSSRELRFYTGSQFEMYRADTLYRSGYYSLEYGSDSFDLSYSIYREDPLMDQWAEFPSEDTLQLRDKCSDCYTWIYKRIE